VILAISLGISALMWQVQVDQDFFSQLYVGRGVWEGGSIYKDFTDNKGPWLYWMFALLYGVFGDNYALALVVSRGLIIGLTVWGLAEWVCIRKGTKAVWLITILLGGLLFSLNINGVYAESLSLVLLVWGINMIFWEKYEWAGILAVGAMFSRQTFVFFIPYLIFALNQGEEKERWLRFARGAGLVILMTMGFLVIKGEIGAWFLNTIYFNINYARAVQELRWNSIKSGLRDLGWNRVLYGWLIAIIGVVWEWIKKGRRSRELLVLLVCSIGATYSGGIFYPHHFTQFLIIIAGGLGVIFGEIRNIYLSGVAAVLILSSVSEIFRAYWVDGKKGWFNSLNYQPAGVESIKQKRYLMVISYHPKFYFDYAKRSPDRYFQPFFLSRDFNVSAHKEVANHKVSMKSKLEETAFVLVRDKEVNKRLAEEYFDNFGKEFDLVKVDSRELPGGELEVYWAKK